MKFFIFFSIFIALFFIQTVTIKKWFIDKSLFSFKTKRFLTLFLYVVFILVLLYPIERYYPFVPNWFYFLSSLSIGIIFITFCITLIYKLFDFFLKHTNFTPKRRDFFKKSADITTLSLITATSANAMNTARNTQIEEIEVKIKNLKQPYKIAQLSDIHIGGLIDKSFIKNLVDKTNSLNADIVVITGDLVDTKLEFAKTALNELKNLKSKYGVFYIVGNHEYFHGVKPIIDYVNSLGIKTLENKNVYIGQKDSGFNLAGVYDIFGERYGSFQPNLQKAMENVKNSPTILLAHQPKFINQIENTKGLDLILCGHTHGGQIFPFNYLVKLQQPYVKGLNQHNEFTQVYVNKGTGFWGPPMRLGTTSEITLLKLS